MSNFMFTQVYVMVLIVCSGIIEPVELFNADLPLKSKEADILINEKFPPTSISQNAIAYSNETDNPNNEQKLMVETFIRSSNSLFKRETDIDDKSEFLSDIYDPLLLRLRLMSKPIESHEKSNRFIRSEGSIIYNKVGTIRPLVAINRRGERRSVPGWLPSRLHIPQDRVSRRRCCEFIKDWNIINNRLSYHPSRYFTPEGRNRRLRRRRGRPHYNVVPTRNIIQGRRAVVNKTPLIAEKVLSLPNTHEEMEKSKPGSKRLCKRQDFCNPMRRSRCKKIFTWTTRSSVNDGKTGRIAFPSTHRCLGRRTCPCSVALEKCPPRVTCPVSSTCFIVSTIGRCAGMDLMSVTPPGDDMCPVRTTRRRGRSPRKRCPCDCGCGCPAVPRRPHPDRNIVRGSCGCGCGCGCSHLTGRPDT